ncbi:MAG: hypothetical protein HC851_05735 [Acaryochloris sp. RU_4_1]|nr:hypothetical protein [Acaryochloris sp. RU_4_1]
MPDDHRHLLHTAPETRVIRYDFVILKSFDMIVILVSILTILIVAKLQLYPHQKLSGYKILLALAQRVANATKTTNILFFGREFMKA